MTRVCVVFAFIMLVVGLGAGCGEGGGKSSSVTQARQDAARTQRLRSDIKFAFGGDGIPNAAAPWYSLIDRINIVGKALNVETSIYPDNEGRQIAKEICNILNANYVLAHGANYGLDNVTVYGQGNDPLSYTSAFNNGQC